MSAATCPDCGERFDKGAPWMKTCTPCWKVAKRAEHVELLDLREEVRELRDAFAEVRAADLPPDMLARLIRLCHPDKHNGSEAATVATQWLLARREART